MPKSQKTAPNAIELLKEDHAKVKKAFKEFEKMDKEDVASVKEVVSAVCEDLKAHTMIEEEIFYPAARQARVDEALLDEAVVEHGSAKELIAQIGASQDFDTMYDARVKVLGETIQHHVKDEERELFPACRKSDMDMAELGQRLKRRKQQLLRKLNAKDA